MPLFSRLALALCLALATSAAQAQAPAAPVGLWQCTVNSDVVLIELEMQVSADNSLYGRGTIHYPGTSAFIGVEGYGDWTLLPPDAYSPNYLFKFRMMPPNHAIFAWFVAPTGVPGSMYNLFRNPQNGIVTETQCSKFG